MQVRELAFILDLPVLASMAEGAAVRGPWEGPSGQVLRDMLQTMPAERVSHLLHSPSRSAVSELEVWDAGLLVHAAAWSC